MLLVILITIILICLSVFFIPFEHTSKGFFNIDALLKFNRLPGPKSWPFFGIAMRLSRLTENDLVPFWAEMFKNFPRICKLRAVGVSAVYISEPEDIEVILSNVKHIDKGIEYLNLPSWLNEGLLISKGTKWHKRRKLLTPTFHFKILQDNLSSLNKHTRVLLKKMLSKSGESIDVHSDITLCTLDVICDSAMGIDLNSQKNEGTEYVEAIKSVTFYIVWRVLRFWYARNCVFYLTKIGQKYKKNLEILHKFSEKIILKRKEEYANRDLTEDDDDGFGKKRKAFLDSLIEMEMKNPNTWTLQDIREEVDTFMFEGHDTTSAALTFSIYSLGLYPNIQEKVYQEQYSLFGDSTREATNHDLNEMVYLEKFIKETLRLYPSVPYISRELTSDAILNDGVVIPKHSNVAIMPFMIHRNERYFPNPEVFDPERFNADECTKRHPFCYIPFSAGPRNCIGQKFAMMELKVVLSTLVRFMTIETLTKGDIQLQPLTILRPSEPIKVSVRPRENAENLVD